MKSFLGELVLVVSGLALSFLLSGMEAGVFALSRLRIRQRVRAGQPEARLLYTFLQKPENFIWTILVGNTVTNFVAVYLISLGVLAVLGHWPLLCVGAWVVMIILLYTLCDLLPKTLFRLYPNRLCLFAVRPFRLIHLALRPLVALVARFANLLLRVTGERVFTGRLFRTREELRLIVQESAQVLSPEERVLINRVLDWKELSVEQVMVPWPKVVAVEAGTRMQEVLRISREQHLTRLPVWRREDDRQRVIGMLSLKTLLFQTDLDPEKPAAEYMKPALYLAGELKLDLALQKMQRSGQRLGIVLGANRQEIGVISFQDLLQVIFGEVSL